MVSFSRRIEAEKILIIHTHSDVEALLVRAGLERVLVTSEFIAERSMFINEVKAVRVEV